VRFINLIPLGYLNIVGCEIYFVFGVEELLLFLLGIIFTEAFIIYFNLICAKADENH
jgi:hypothetical protein